jgi:hypothetical protein
VDHGKRFRELAAVAALPPRTLVLDGQVAIFDRHPGLDSTGCAILTPRR